VALAIQHLGYGHLGGFREDLITALSIAVGKSKATKIVNDMFTTIRTEAEKGARAGVKKEIPNIRKQVREEATVAATGALKEKVSPLVIGSLAASAIALGVGFIAIIGARRR
jgi:hypothetical protein